MKSVLISGDLGFVGRHMAAELVGRGWSVSGFDNRGEPGSTLGQHHHYRADVRQLSRREAPGHVGIRGHVFDLVVHCAYAVGGRAAIEGVPMNLAHNLAADAALFEWALTTGQRRVLYFSSSAAYPVEHQTARWVDMVGPGGMPLFEEDIDLTDAEEPDANYGWAKLTGERLAAAAAHEGLPVHVVRPFSGYGGDQSTDYPFPALLARVLRGDDPVEVWGSARQVRDWIHIDDVVAGALAVVDADERRPVNLCTGRATSMAELIALMSRTVHPDRQCPKIDVLTGKPLGVHWRVGDPARMREHYTPAVTLEDGIERAAVWLRKNAEAAA